MTSGTRPVRLSRSAAAVCLARPIDTFAGPARNRNPAHHMVGCQGSGGMLDYIGMFIHGFTQTHIDALAPCHLRTHDNRYWNDKPVGPLGMPAEHSGTIDFWNDGIVTAWCALRHSSLAGHRVCLSRAARDGLGSLRRRSRARHRTTRRADAVLIRSGHSVLRTESGSAAGVRLAEWRARHGGRVPLRDQRVALVLGLAGRAD